MAPLRSVVILRNKSPLLFAGALLSTLAILFVARYLIDASVAPAAPATANAVGKPVAGATVVHDKVPEGVAAKNAGSAVSLCRLPQTEVYGDAHFSGTGVTPAELQGADSRWETASLFRRESNGFVHGLGAASADDACPVA